MQKNSICTALRVNGYYVRNISIVFISSNGKCFWRMIDQKLNFYDSQSNVFRVLIEERENNGLSIQMSCC